MTQANWDDMFRRRAGMLASDADRDVASQALVEAFGQGRLTQEEFDDRSTRALAARTFGDLDAVLTGLPAFQRSPIVFDVDTQVELAESAGVPTRKFNWFSMLFFTPFVLIGVLSLLKATNLEGVIFGLIFILVPLSFVFGNGRARPRS